MIYSHEMIKFLNNFQFKKDWNKLQFFKDRCLHCTAKDCKRTAKELFQCGMNKY